ncbi:hypothetical protein GGS23DRAFT_620820 [Durotheca rogersii]|uniref:uncharacterized protein n=1 Tax=Durotheca rogersii TaxID=419775 RepID=UPI0022202437|nr:uncharacterized protein GGS23DRAFT_620820 [Durotheca rogersii]KAI5863935.1 hypothetical protein GGS23DRAFT_620820 [Durotheca rogersii]
MTQKTVAFFGASTGVGLSALRHTLAAGHKCIALCRTPSKLTAVLPPASNPNLRVVEGNAHDVAAVSRCLRKDDGSGALVDAVVSTIGGKPTLSWKLLDDPEVCQRGMQALLGALAALRSGADASGPPAAGRPRVVVCSTTGLSRAGRDVPLALAPLYHVLLRTPHADKRAMEDALAASGERFTVVRPSLLVDGATDRPVRVGVEDPRAPGGPRRESAAVGYTISREDAGRWIAENIILLPDEGAAEDKYLDKVATITY